MVSDDFLERYRERTMFAVYVLLVPWTLGLASGRLLHPELLTFAVGFVVLFWCALDARLHDKSFHHSFVLPFMATWPLSLAIYLVWTRGVRGLAVYGVAVGAGLAIVFVGAIMAALVSTCGGSAAPGP